MKNLYLSFTFLYEELTCNPQEYSWGYFFQLRKDPWFRSILQNGIFRWRILILSYIPVSCLPRWSKTDRWTVCRPAFVLVNGSRISWAACYCSGYCLEPFARPPFYLLLSLRNHCKGWFENHWKIQRKNILVFQIWNLEIFNAWFVLGVLSYLISIYMLCVHV